MSRPAAAQRTVIAPAAGQPLTFDERLALSGLAMDARLDTASADHSIRTAHIPDEAPELLVPPQQPGQPTTVEEVLREAARLIDTHGLIRGYVGRAETGYCTIGAIRAAAGGNRPPEDAAEAEMLERIRRQFPDTLSVGEWSDAQPDKAPVLRMLT